MPACLLCLQQAKVSNLLASSVANASAQCS